MYTLNQILIQILVKQELRKIKTYKNEQRNPSPGENSFSYHHYLCYFLFSASTEIKLQDIGEVCGGKDNVYGICKDDTLFCDSYYTDWQGISEGTCVPKKCEEDVEECQLLVQRNIIPPRNACGQGKRTCADSTLKKKCPISCDICNYNPFKGECDVGLCAAEESTAYDYAE